MKHSFFDLLWPKKPDAFLSTWTKQSGAIRFFHTSQFAEAEHYMAAKAEHEDVYFCVGLLARRPASGRGSGKDVAYLPCMHADFDIGGGATRAHVKIALPNSLEELQDFLTESKVPQPSLFVNSGNGIHAYWFLDSPLCLLDPDAHSKASADLKRFQRAIIDLAKRYRGWDFDNTADLARVLRWPGTLNHKSTPPKLVEVIQHAH